MDSDGNAGFTNHGGNVTPAGYDRLLNDGVRVGAAFNYGHEDMNEPGDGATAALDSYRVLAYGGYGSGPVEIGGVVSLGRDRVHADRAIDLGAAERTAASSHTGTDVSAATEAGYRFVAGATTLMPFITLDYVHLRQPGFTESGADTLSLSVASQDYDSLQSEAGLRIAQRLGLGNGNAVTIEGHAGLRYEAMDRERR